MVSVTNLARQLRQEMTDAELKLWQVLRARRFHGFKFTRQKPIFYQSKRVNERSFFIADFHCHERKLVVELDGPIHDFQKEYDSNRDEILLSLGLRTLRLKNEELENMTLVRKKILEALNEDSPPAPLSTVRGA